MSCLVTSMAPFSRAAPTAVPLLPALHALDEVDALLDGRGKLRLHLIEPVLLVLRDLADLPDGRHASRAELHLGGEVRDAVRREHVRLDVRALNDVGLAREALQARVAHER